MEYLHRCIQGLEVQPKFSYHPRCKKLNITNVSFADDILLFTRGDTTSVQILMKKIENFSMATGLKAHPEKCHIYFWGVPSHIQMEILKNTGFTEGALPFKYLGIPLDSKKLYSHHFRPIMDKLVVKIKHWITRLLSYAGRRQLINSTLFAITAYWMQIFTFPKIVVKQIEMICGNFLWCGMNGVSKKAPIAWENLCKPVFAGGLNIVSLHVWNKATIGKLLWNIHIKEDKLWKRWLDTYFLKKQDIVLWLPRNNISWTVRKFLKARDIIKAIDSWNDDITHGKYKTAAKPFRRIRTGCLEENPLQ
ncbi:uncharacterized protein LOC131597167 [Vicia villosa]|uniref:uncharacterized protein LOC131597167 n=1 Tax=Vicia villosa TaxID=3911 RepID=UPI00273ACB3B|nr:uncharacterized protein LOC131597167 [Vicia villosa]